MKKSLYIWPLLFTLLFAGCKNNSKTEISDSIEIEVTKENQEQTYKQIKSLVNTGTLTNARDLLIKNKWALYKNDNINSKVSCRVSKVKRSIKTSFNTNSDTTEFYSVNIKIFIEAITPNTEELDLLMEYYKAHVADMLIKNNINFEWKT